MKGEGKGEKRRRKGEERRIGEGQEEVKEGKIREEVKVKKNFFFSTRVQDPLNFN